MNTKRILALLLGMCLMLALCACGGNSDNTTESTTDPVVTTTQPVETTTEALDPSYIVKVVDEGGNPIANVAVQLCLETCTLMITDANGIANFYNLDEADYEVKIAVMPQGYGYTTEEEVFFFEDGSNEVTITLQAIA